MKLKLWDGLQSVPSVDRPKVRPTFSEVLIMRLFNYWRLLLPLVIISPLAAAPPQQQESEEARGAFMVTRKNPAGSKPDATSQKSNGPVRNPPASKTKDRTAPPKTEIAKKTGDKAAPGQQSAEPSPQPPAPEPGAIGLGYTLYQRAASGEVKRVRASQPFYENDQVRFVIEPNTDGYLYIFYTENDGEPEMIFPDHRLSQGANQVKAHVPYEAPSSNAPIKWFSFTDNISARLQLFIVVTRQPLPNVPTGQELLTYCKTYGDDCVWKPSREYFKPVLEGDGEKKLMSKREAPGRVLASTETDAITRGIKLKAQELEPDVIYLNTSAKSDVLVVSAALKQHTRP